MTSRRAFRDQAEFGHPDRYFLLPFKFHVITPEREVLVNAVGDYFLCPRGTAARLARHEVLPNEPLFSDLLAGFFVSDKPCPDLVDVLATRYRTKKAFLEDFTALHILVVTLRCDHSCHYCQVSRQTADRARYDMSPENLELAIDHIFRSPAPHLTVEFQGGEPLLAFDLVRSAIEAVTRRNKSHGRKITFVLCTNLVGVTEPILDFCAEHSVLISTSLDGPAAIHEANRPTALTDAFSRFQRNLERARDRLGRDRVAALLTTSRAALKSPEAIIDTYVHLGFDRIFLRPIHPYGFASRLAGTRLYGVDDFLSFYKRALAHIVTLNLRGTAFVEDYTALLLQKMLTPFGTGFVDLQSPAGAITGVIVYNYDGGVYATDESRMLAETGDRTFRLGHVADRYEQLVGSSFARRLVADSVNEALAGCADCGLQAYCGSDPIRNHATQGDVYGFRPTSAFCRKNMEMIRYLFDLLDTDPVAARLFRSWAA